jgi:site-specific recombinase XerD
VSADDVTDFVLYEAARHKPSGRREAATAMRALLRFLETRGAVRPGLDGAVPAMRQHKHASLPRHLTDEEVGRLVASCGESTPLGRRDRAVLVLLARLGLRAREVAVLQLDDIDWSDGRVLVRAGKTGRERSLPLHDDVGSTIVDYLRHGRPATSDRLLFRHARPPWRPLRGSGVTGVAQRAFARAGVSFVRPGASAFRHTAATQMVRRGATFKEIADVLGHARIETTTIYAKLDVDTLARVALPWPGGAR